MTVLVAERRLRFLEGRERDQSVTSRLRVLVLQLDRVHDRMVAGEELEDVFQLGVEVKVLHRQQRR